MSDKTFEIFRSAVTISRNQHIHKVGVLRSRLLDMYPGCEIEINEALMFWAASK